MAITSLMVKGLAISPEAIQRNADEWERRGRNWQGVDRFEMTEQQMISVVEKLYDTDYFSSTYLMSPSIPEFAVLIQEPDDYVNTYVCFRRTLLKEDDILTDDQDGLQKTVTPVIDAYVYANNKGTLCNIVITLGRCELRRDSHMMPCTAQVLSYTHRDPMTEYMLERPEDLRDFMRNVKSIYLAIQMLSLERPEVFVTKTEKVTHQETIRKKGRYKKVNKTKLVKVTRVSDEALNAIEPHSIRTFTCPCWGVAGHWRTYKSGKKIWINPYRKGKQRSNPAAYTPKYINFQRRKPLMFDIYFADCLGRENNCLYPHKATITDAESLAQAVSHDYVCARYKNNYRNNTNFEESDCLAWEFDNDHSENPEDWIEPMKLAEEFPDVPIGIHYSRHHMLPKGDKGPRPRFHAFMMIKRTTDGAAYSALKKKMYSLFPFADTNALDAARFFFGTKDPKTDFFPGTKTLDEFLEEADFDEDMNQGSYGSRVIKEGSRNSTMSRFAGKLVKRFGWNITTHSIFMEEATKCDPPLPDAELDRIWQSARKFEKTVSEQPGYIPPEKFNAAIPMGELGSLKPSDYSDIGQAKVLKREYGDELAFHPGTDFLHYDDTVWNESKEEAYGATEEFLDLQLADAQLMVFQAREAFLRAGGDEEALGGSKKAAAKLNEEMLELLLAYLSARAYEAFVMKRRDAKYINAVMTTVKPLVLIKLEQLNHDPLLLNTPSATYNLAEGLEGRREHRADDFCTKITAVDPGDKGKELWLDALNKTFQNDQELIDYVQEVVGLASVGKVYMEAMIIAYGGGRNGKSTFWNTISRVLGSYSGDVSADTLTVGCRRNVKPEMAELKGVRLALAKELEEGMRMNTSVVKQLTSTDQIFGEKKFCKPAHFTPSHTLVLYTNHLPRVGATDDGTWRRLIVIPFTAVFTGKKDHKNYADFLFENAGPYILKWIIEGAQRIISKGYHLTNPTVVQEAIDAYRNQNDWMEDFLEDCCELGPTYSCKSGELYQEYRAYCLRMGEFARSTSDFYTELDKREFERKKTKTGMVIKGLQLKQDFSD